MRHFSKSSLKLLALIAAVALVMPAMAMNVTELELKNSNKVVFKVRFNNGSVSDPADKKGLTAATASLMGQGGAGGMD